MFVKEGGREEEKRDEGVKVRKGKVLRESGNRR